MTGDDILQAFGLDAVERRLQREEFQRRRCSRQATPAAVDPALQIGQRQDRIARGAVSEDQIPGAAADRNCGHAGRAAERLLWPDHRDVDAEIADVELMAADRGDRIDDGDDAASPGKRQYLGQGLRMPLADLA